MKFAAIAFVSLFAVDAGVAQTAAVPPAAGTPTSACSTADYRAFDFWLGEWQVTGGPKLDTVVGHNRIEKVASGCALSEHWVNANGRDGRSLNVYDSTTQQWTQFWIGSDGVVLRLHGGLEGNDMLLKGTLPGASGGEQLQRIRWTPKDNGSVVQRWETSDDSGVSWQVGFVGIYRRAEAAASANSADSEAP